jgi:mRNA-degrading endonuclease RelE of RelBE toxin-antitoxin system
LTVVKSQRTKKFKKIFNKLPSHVQAQVEIAYEHFKRDPWYSSLEFKCVNKGESIYSIRIGIHYRALGYMRDDTIIWYWVGTHSDYDHLI